MFHKSRRSNTRRLVALCGTTMLFCAFIVMSLIFLSAFASPAKSAIIHINMFNEAPIELLILGATFVLGSFSIFHLFDDYRKEVKAISI